MTPQEILELLKKAAQGFPISIKYQQQEHLHVYNCTTKLFGNGEVTKSITVNNGALYYMTPQIVEYAFVGVREDLCRASIDLVVNTFQNLAFVWVDQD